MIIVRSKHTRAVQIYQSIDDFLVPQWSKVVDIIRAQATKFYSNLTIRIETIAMIDKNLIDFSIFTSRKRSRIDLFSNSLINDATSKARLTRTNRLLEQSRSRASVAKNMGNIDRQLTAYWQCHDKRCINQNDYCFVDYIDKHYNMEAPKQAR